jgi:hypothetical protein
MTKNIKASFKIKSNKTDLLKCRFYQLNPLDLRSYLFQYCTPEKRKVQLFRKKTGKRIWKIILFAGFSVEYEKFVCRLMH